VAQGGWFGRVDYFGGTARPVSSDVMQGTNMRPLYLLLFVSLLFSCCSCSTKCQDRPIASVDSAANPLSKIKIDSDNSDILRQGYSITCGKLDASKQSLGDVIFKTPTQTFKAASARIYSKPIDSIMTWLIELQNVTSTNTDNGSSMSADSLTFRLPLK